ncbi:MAG: DUF3014 domain-containing protein [Vicinamibacterales bacterium]
MAQLDDLPIDPERETDSTARYSDTTRRSRTPLVVAVVAIAVVGGLGWYFWQRNRPAPPAPVVAAAPPAEPVAAPPPPAVVLPPLDEMDPFLRTLLSGLSSHPQLLAWLATDDLLGSLATAIDRMAQGQSPARDLAPLRPGPGFAVATRRGTTVIAPASYARYDAVAAAVASVEPARLAEAFRTIEPRLTEAWTRQGHRGSVRDAVQRAAAFVAGTPDTPEELAVVRRVSGYGYANPELQALPPLQRHLLRMGPANVARIREAASAFGAALATDR